MHESFTELFAGLFAGWPLLTAFFLASIALAITPGPGVFYIVTRTLMQDRRAGFASVAGVALGNLGNAIGAALGLAALFAISSLAFLVVKYAGAAYLIYLGIKTFRDLGAPQSSISIASSEPVPLKRIFRDGFVVALFNPKTTIFFAAFLPQFMHPGASPAMQSVVLGSLFVIIAAVTDSIYVWTASWIAPRLGKFNGIHTLGRYLAASTFIGLAILTALGKHPKST